MIEYNDFVAYSPETVRQIVHERYGQNLGVGIPFNGTRRWYLEHFNKSPEDLFDWDYPEQVSHQMRQIMGMMFADGVAGIYTPVIGRDLAERGAEYMEFANASIMYLSNEKALNWHLDNKVRADYYGHLNLLSDDMQTHIHTTTETTTAPDNQHYVRYGVFADESQALVINQTLALAKQLGHEPTASELIEAFYGKPQIDMQMWIGSDQPSIFDVPLVMHGSTALYFLQFPTLYLDNQSWRRLLYDILYVRGDEESLYPDNVTEHRSITGLGTRTDNYWSPATD